MNPIVLKVLMTLAIEALKLLRKYYDSMTPEQREEFRQACLTMKDPMGGDGSGP
jgi:hypothetical protein